MPARQFVPSHKRKERLAIAVIVVALALIFIIPPARMAVRRTFGGIGMGIARGSSSLGGWVASIGTDLRTKHSLSSENNALKAQVSELQSRLIETDTLARENADLKASLSRTGSSHFTLAAILSKPPRSPYDTLVIDGGKSAGLSGGQMVYGNGANPIGTITEVMPNSAIVKLFSAPGEHTEARLSPSGLDIDLVGRGGGNYSATVPHDLVVDPAATAVTKEINPHIIGIFKKVTSDARDPFQTLLLEAPVNVMHLSFVQVRQ